jgi:hypothetical protein
MPRLEAAPADITVEVGVECVAQPRVADDGGLVTAEVSYDGVDASDGVVDCPKQPFF